ncbi:hypothetical protein CEXT_791791 [Caerostris extrusa]|uniref:Uncharacterized protein n=1 Tax=Caerostris extrusa TaxID=172846 RepID=A0AAV4V837_CAEEX|nr:hypothetical protein CEXT_791791 [Caerostris extrusa]
MNEFTLTNSPPDLEGPDAFGDRYYPNTRFSAGWPTIKMGDSLKVLITFPLPVAWEEYFGKQAVEVQG